jgi:hypothetical protein
MFSGKQIELETIKLNDMNQSLEGRSPNYLFYVEFREKIKKDMKVKVGLP